MDQGKEEPKRVTPTEARAKLLRSLVVPPVGPPKDKDRAQHDNSMAEFIREMLRQDDATSGQ